jgi:hypothetical protein
MALGEILEGGVVNLREMPRKGASSFGDSVQADRDYIFYDELHDVRYPRKGEELHAKGLFVRLEGFQSHLFDVTLA